MADITWIIPGGFKNGMEEKTKQYITCGFICYNDNLLQIIG